MKKKIQLCLILTWFFSGLKGHSFVSVFGLLEPLSMMKQQQKIRILNNGGGREREGTKT